MSKDQESGWVPIRKSIAATGSDQKYGQITWDDLAYGNRLEINVDHLNSLLQKMDITYPVHIRSISSSKRSKNTPTSLPNQDGSTSANAVHLSSEKKPTDSKFIFDQELEKFIILFESTQIAEKVENSLPDGMRNATFFDEYANRLNAHLKNTLFKAKFYELMVRADSDPQLAQEVFGAYFSFFTDVLVTIVFAIKFTSEAVQQKLTYDTVTNDLLLLYAAFTAYYICFQHILAVFKAQPKGEIENRYLDALKATFDFMKTSFSLRSYFFPYILAQKLLPQLVENRMFDKPLFRTRKNSG